MPVVTKTIYVLIGLPLAGKSTYSKQLALPGECLLIERDAFLEGINRDPETQAKLVDQALSITNPVSRLSSDPAKNAFNDALTLEYTRRVIEAIRASSASTVIVDGTHLQALSRSFVHELADARKIAVVFPPDPELSIARLSSTKLEGVRSTVTPDMIRRMAEVYEAPTPGEGFDEIISP